MSKSNKVHVSFSKDDFKEGIGLEIWQDMIDKFGLPQDTETIHTWVEYQGHDNA